MTDISIKEEMRKLPRGERYAMYISRIMGNWWFVGLIGGIIGSFIIHCHLWNGNVLDVFNLVVSLYTLLVDIIILQANNALNNSFLTIMNKIISLEETMIGLVTDVINTQKRHGELLEENNNMLKQLLADRGGIHK